MLLDDEGSYTDGDNQIERDYIAELYGRCIVSNCMSLHVMGGVLHFWEAHIV
jgi:hypothetical protein